MAAFTWGKNGEKLTPEMVNRMRIASELMKKEATATTPVASPFAGLNRALQGFIVGRDNKRADKGETEGLASADAAIAGILGGQGGGYAAPSYTASTAGQGAPGVVAPTPVDPAAALGADAMAALGVEAPAAGHDHGAAHPGASHGDWLKYSNQNATRNDPLDPALVEAMAFLPDLGITMDVISGGQEAAGEGGARKGSVRHDHGKSADADFYKDGRKLDWNNPADLPILTQIVQTAKSRGVTGIGAGDDYMGAGRFHVGFGAPAVWGAGGKSANAPQWLVEAYNGAPAGSAPAVPTYDTAGGAPAVPGGMGGTDIASLLALQANPWVTQKYGGVVDALMGQQFDRQNALWEQQQRMADPMYQAQLEMAQLELERAQAPQAVDPFAGTKEIGGVLYGPDGQGGFVPLITPPVDPGYAIIAPEEVAALGLPPGAYQRGPKGEIKQVGGGGTSVTVNNGGAPGQYLYGTDAGVPAGWRVDTITGVASPIPGGPAAVEAEQLAAKEGNKDSQGQMKLGTTLESINLNLGEIENGGLPVTGLIGDARRTWLGRALTGDSAVDFGNRTAQITDQAALAEVQNMRDNSPTGGAVGSLTDSERVAIGNSVTAINNSTSPEEYARAAKAYRKLALDIAYGEGTWELDENGQPVAKTDAPPPAEIGKGGGLDGVADALSDEPIEGFTAEEWQFLTPEEKAELKRGQK